MISEAFNLVNPVKKRVSDHFIEMGSLPGDNKDLGLPDPENLLGTTVTSVTVRQGGLIQVQLGADTEIQTMSFVPAVSSSSGHLFWRCLSDTIDKGVLEKLRPTCEHQQLSNESQLQQAIVSQDLAKIDHWLEQGTDPDAYVVGLTALMMAVETGNPDIIRRMVNAGANPNLQARTHEGYTPLIAAIKTRKPDIVALLLDSQASALTTDLQGRAPREYALAADAGTDSVFSFLIDASLNPQFKSHPAESYKSRRATENALWAHRTDDASAQSSPMELAIHSRNLQQVRQLIDLGANVNRQTSNQSRYLIEASKRGYTDLVSLLIDQGARIDATDRLGRTAYLAAVGTGHDRVAEMLAEAGADTRAVDNNGVDAMQMLRSRVDRNPSTLQIASTED